MCVSLGNYLLTGSKSRYVSFQYRDADTCTSQCSALGTIGWAESLGDSLLKDCFFSLKKFSGVYSFFQENAS